MLSQQEKCPQEHALAVRSLTHWPPRPFSTSEETEILARFSLAGAVGACPFALLVG